LRQVLVIWRNLPRRRILARKSPLLKRINRATVTGEIAQAVDLWIKTFLPTFGKVILRRANVKPMAGDIPDILDRAHT
jgi:hypothetical protein